MAVYNAADTLVEAVDSILGQTLDAIELICVDDGSTDESPSILESYAKRDARVRAILCEHDGIVATHRVGIASAQGEFIARMDADDISLPTRLEKQLVAFESDPSLVLCGCGVEMIGDVGEGRARYADWMNGLITHEEIYRERFVECPIAHPAFLLRRSQLDAVGGYADHPWPEDYDLFLRIAETGGRLHNLPEVLFQWRESKGRLSMNDANYSLEAFRDCKMHYLRRSVLADERPFYQWGAGEVGKAWLRGWGKHGPRAAVDINPRKIGKVIHGVPIIAPDDLPAPGEAFTLAAVGAPGARSDIRAWFGERGYVEERDYLFVA